MLIANKKAQMFATNLEHFVNSIYVVFFGSRIDFPDVSEFITFLQPSTLVICVVIYFVFNTLGKYNSKTIQTK